ncbi:surface protease GP63, partial [Trypanosoma theileri]
QLLCSALLLFLLCCAYGCAAAAVVKPLPEKGQGAWDAYTVAVEDTKSEDGWEPIRIGVYPGGVSVWIKSCANMRAPTFGRSIHSYCSGGYRITPEKVQMLNDIVAEGAKMHSDRLRVKRVKGRLFLDKNGGKDFKKNCPNAVARLDYLQKGFPNVDFALFVGPTVTREHPKICTKDDKKRPTSALIKVNTKEFMPTRYYFRLAAHDIGHGLGFDLDVFKEHSLMREIPLHLGWVIAVLESNIVKEKVREHYGCPDISTMELEGRDKGHLFENYVFYPHIKRHFAKDELMSTDLERPSGMYYTNLTLAVFDSMPFYKADFSRAETMSWGRKAGCGFIKGKCVEWGISRFPDMFCVDESYDLHCTTDRTALGKCSLQFLPWDYVQSEFNYFPRYPRGSAYSDWMDFCPAIEPTFETSCEFGYEREMPGSIVSSTSRCLKVDFVRLRNKGVMSNVKGICAEVKCENGTLKVRYKGNKNWYECPEGDSIDNINGSVFDDGRILCPKYADVCTK